MFRLSFGQTYQTLKLSDNFTRAIVSLSVSLPRSIHLLFHSKLKLVNSDRIQSSRKCKVYVVLNVIAFNFTATAACRVHQILVSKHSKYLTGRIQLFGRSLTYGVNSFGCLITEQCWMARCMYVHNIHVRQRLNIRSQQYIHCMVALFKAFST